MYMCFGFIIFSFNGATTVENAKFSKKVQCNRGFIKLTQFQLQIKINEFFSQGNTTRSYDSVRILTVFSCKHMYFLILDFSQEPLK